MYQSVSQNSENQFKFDLTSNQSMYTIEWIQVKNEEKKPIKVSQVSNSNNICHQRWSS